eukprot:1973077-Alexandrium_andersonii.AAC.1
MTPPPSPQGRHEVEDQPAPRSWVDNAVDRAQASDEGDERTGHGPRRDTRLPGATVAGPDITQEATDSA